MRRAKALLALTALSAALGACFPPALSEAEMSDSGIRSRLEAGLHAHRDLDISKVSIDVHLRVVTISGLVPSYNDRRIIESVVRATAGIEQSVVNLVVPE